MAGASAGKRLHTDEHLPIGSDLRSAGQARAAVAALLLGAGWAPEVIEDACTLVSEAVTNAVEHGGGVVDAYVDVDAERLRFAVADRSEQLPAPQQPDPWATSGRGVALINELADRWGVELGRQDEGAKWVWFEVHRVGRPSSASDPGAARSPAGPSGPAEG